MKAIDSFKAQQGALIAEIGEGNAHMIWALGMLTDASDLFGLASRALTDGGNDKKIDFLEIDSENKKIILGQGYYAQKDTDKASANKASDLNTAGAWLISGDVENEPTLNEKVRGAIRAAREKIDKGEIDTIEIVYIHNIQESMNVDVELTTCASQLEKALLGKGIVVTGFEFGLLEQERLFVEKETHIFVKDEISIGMPHFHEQGPDWDAQVFTVNGDWLRELFVKYGDQLFSANYRGFLGHGKKRNKINRAIMTTAEKKQGDFWAFNNGVTILTHEIVAADPGKKLRGISVINGAQTTGALGSVDKNVSLSDVKVLCRAVICKDPEKAREIVKYNNTQNEITSWDQYANDVEQGNLVEQFAKLGAYRYSLKRGFDSTDSDLGIEMLAQPSLAFQGFFADANRGKNAVFDSPELYRRAFQGRNAKKLLLAYCFSRAIDHRRITLTQKIERTRKEESQLALFGYLSFKNFLLAVIGATLEAHLGKAVNLSEAAFSTEAAKQGLDYLTILCAPVVNSTLIWTEVALKGPANAEKIKDEKAFAEVADSVSAAIDANYETTGTARDAELVKSIYRE
ncbi:AIPR family protein [Paraburkholderia sp. MM5477-R1]|uniref:AIPR family protein n=1 Tax=Paraburkholderia sp. MM5477-R1 TaxID=2991062 RepID=UPI003D1CBE14